MNKSFRDTALCAGLLLLVFCFPLNVHGQSSTQRAKFEQRRSRLKQYHSAKAKFIDQPDAADRLAVQPSEEVDSHPAAVSNFTDWLPFLPLATAQPSSERSFSGSIALADSRHLADLKDRDFCRAVVSELRKQIPVSEGQISSLSVHGYGVPIGNYRKNEQRHAGRSQLLKESLIDQQIAQTVTVTWTAEDWATIERLTQADNTLMLRSAALDVMQNVDLTAGREDQLRMLGGGRTYAELQKRIFPRVQRIEFKALLKQQIANATNAIALERLYETAAGLTKGSAEFNDIIDLAARLYPDNAVACINAASVALMKGELEKTAAYLERWQTDARAYQTLGVLYLLQGDTARAEVYLKMAQANGVREASVVLKEIE